MATALRLIEGGQQRLDETRIEVLSALDEAAETASALRDIAAEMESDYRRITGVRDLRFRSITFRLDRLATHMGEARAEYTGLTGGAA